MYKGWPRHNWTIFRLQRSVWVYTQRAWAMQQAEHKPERCREPSKQKDAQGQQESPRTGPQGHKKAPEISDPTAFRKEDQGSLILGSEKNTKR